MCECPVHLCIIASSLAPADVGVVGRVAARGQKRGARNQHEAAQSATDVPARRDIAHGMLALGAAVLRCVDRRLRSERRSVLAWRSYRSHCGRGLAIATGAASSHLKLTERFGWVLAWSTILSNY